MVQDEMAALKQRLKNSIVRICREGLSCEGTFKIDALLCISICDQDREIIVKIHEDASQPLKDPRKTWENFSPENSSEKSFTNGDYIREHREEQIAYNPPSSRKLPYSPEVVGHAVPLPSTNAVMDNTSRISNEQSLLGKSAENTSNEYGVHEGQRDVDMVAVKLENGESSEFSNEIDVNNPYRGRVPHCTKCNALFDSVLDLESHNHRVHTTFTCKHCLRAFTSRPNMQRHVRRHIGYKPFACSVCGFSFTRKDDYNIHMLKHSMSKPFVCGICSNLYSDRSTLRSHLKKCHKKRLASLCSFCGKGFGCTMTAERHRLFHCTRKFFKDFPHSQKTSDNNAQRPDAFYRCFSCKEIFGDFIGYKMHIVENPSKHTAIWCPPCETEYKTVDEFTDHSCFCDAHNVEVEPVDKIFTFNDNLDESGKTGLHYGGEIPKSQYWCTECKVGFKEEYNFNYHVITRHCSATKSGKSEENVRVPLIDLRATAGFRSSNMDSSNLCVSRDIAENKNSENLRFPDEAIDLSVDSKTSPGQKRHESEANTRESSASMRGDLTSSPTDPVMSFIETYMDNSSNSLSRRSDKHLERSHSSQEKSIYTNMSRNERSLILEFNSKKRTETSPKTLSPHIPSGRDNKDLYAGDGCAFSAVSPGSMSDTQMVSRSGYNISPVFEKSTGEFDHITFRNRRQFSCGFCCENFAEYGKYAEHAMRSHKRFVCDHCGMCFTAKPNRDRHRRYHTGERPYSCAWCPQTFFRGDDLKYHCSTKHPDERSKHTDL